MPILGILDSSKTGNLIGGDFYNIATYNITSNTSSVTFTDGGAWTPYKHLVIFAVTKTNRSAPNDALTVTVNGDATQSNYISEYVEWDGNNVFYPSSSAGSGFINAPGASYANYFASARMTFIDFQTTGKNRTMIFDSSFNQGSTSSGVNNWAKSSTTYVANTNALSSITIGGGTGQIVAGSRFALYGIKG